ncbi:MAG: saccharopine dehydrogenase C-terminal domain-containing protein, partial [Candidatus Bathyarchaeota archaeon]
ELILGDIALERAKTLRNQLKSSKVSVVQTNASDEKSLTSALGKIDVIVNATLPRFNLTVMDAALKSNVHYIDLASWTTVKMQLDLDSAWKDAGLTAILGLGEDPGISNVFARYVADKLDSVEKIRVRDGETVVSEDFPFACLFSPAVFLEEMFERPDVYENGAMHRVEPLTGEELYEFPEPVGPLTVYHVSHEETETLPLFIDKGLRYVDFKLALSPETVQTLKILKQIGLLSDKPLNIKGKEISPKEMMIALFPKPVDLPGKVDGYASILVDAKGEKDGEKVRHIVYTFMSHREAYEKYGATATSYLTGTPPAIGAMMIAKNEIKMRGVISPECLEPKPFMDKLNQKGIKTNEKTLKP